MEKEILEQILCTENDQLEKLNSIVLKAIEEEKLLSHKLIEFEDPHPHFASKISDRVASFGGSWKFIFIFLTAMLVWISVNIYLLTRPFDPYPFILLNLILSTVAAL